MSDDGLSSHIAPRETLLQDSLTRDVFLVVNPGAGRGYAGRTWPAVAAALRAGGARVERHLTRSPAEATELTRHALHDGRTTIVAMGGDGTVNAVVNGFFGGEGGQHVPAARLGIVPCGTGNDLARALGVPRGRDACAAVLAGAARHIDAGCVTCHDRSGKVSTRYFLAVADLGLGAHVVRYAARMPRRAGATLMYLLGTLRAIAMHRNVRAQVLLTDGTEFSADLAIVVVANTPYFGGGMHIAPSAVFDDGLLDVLWLGGTNRARLLFDLLPRVYRGTHLGHPGVGHARVRGVAVCSEGVLLVQVDGELIGLARPSAIFSVLPGALAVLVPH